MMTYNYSLPPQGKNTCSVFILSYNRSFVNHKCEYVNFPRSGNGAPAFRYFLQKYHIAVSLCAAFYKGICFAGFKFILNKNCSVAEIIMLIGDAVYLPRRLVKDVNYFVIIIIITILKDGIPPLFHSYGVIGVINRKLLI